MHSSTSRCIAAALSVALLPAFSPGAAAHELPVGDGHVTDRPARGNVFACRTHFRRGGATRTGAWFHGDTFDPDRKPHVEGSVRWPQARLSIGTSGTQVRIRGNGLPVNEPTGRFPISRSDPAYRYDRNPNSIRATRLDFAIPASPSRARTPGCLPMGMIGITVTGVAIFSALDDGGRDAAAHEVQDRCDGHPQGMGQYHYHSASPCLPGAKSDELVGFALDGYPIFGMKDARGRQLTDKDLDACHGRAERVEAGGRTYDYAYRLTEEYPYTLGCFVGQATRVAHRRPDRRPGRWRRER